MYYGYTLKIKELKEGFNKIEIFFENFGYPSNLEVDNEGEYDNKILKKLLCKIIIPSLPYHPQTNGVMEVTHKEVKNIYNVYFKIQDNFDI